MRGVGGSLPGGGGAADPRARGGEPGEGPRGGVRAGGAGGEPEPQTAVCGARGRAGDPQTGAGAAARGTAHSPHVTLITEHAFQTKGLLCVYVVEQNQMENNKVE